MSITTWLRVAALALVLSVGWYLVSTYNTWVAAEAVAEVDAEYAAKFNDIAAKAKALKATIEANDVAARLATAKAIAEQQERANEATQKYKAELAKNKELVADRNRAMASSSDLLGRVLNDSTASVSGGAEFASVRKYADDLGGRYASCERDLAEAIGEAAKQADRAAEAEAAVRALNKDTK